MLKENLFSIFSVAGMLAVIAFIIINAWGMKKKTETHTYKYEMLLEQKYCIFFIIFVVIGVLLRLYRFAEVPHGINIDEAGMAYDAFSMANYGVERHLQRFPVYLLNYDSGQSALYMYLCAICIKIMGLSMAAIRMPALIFGTLAMIFGGLIAKETLGKKSSLLTVLLMAITPCFFMNARWGLDCNLMLGLSAIAMYFYILAVKRQKNRYFVCMGIFTGLTLYTYAVSYMVIPIFLLFSIGYLLWCKNIKFKQLLYMGIPMAVIGFPLVLLMFMNQFGMPEIATAFITIPTLPEFKTSSVSAASLLENFDLLFTTFTTDGLMYNAFDRYYTLYAISVPLFIYGVLRYAYVFVKKIKEKSADVLGIIFCYLAAYLLVGMFFTSPNINRMNGIYFAIFLFVIYAVWDLYHTIPIKKICAGTIVSVYLISSVCFFHYYFVEYTPEKEVVWWFYDYADDIMNALHESGTDREIYIDNYNGPIFTWDFLLQEVSPYDFCEQNMIDGRIKGEVSMDNYHYYLPEPEEITTDAIYVIFGVNDYDDWMHAYDFEYAKYGYWNIYY